MRGVVYIVRRTISRYVMRKMKTTVLYIIPNVNLSAKDDRYGSGFCSGRLLHWPSGYMRRCPANRPLHLDMASVQARRPKGKPRL